VHNDPLSRNPVPASHHHLVYIGEMGEIPLLPAW
jgi:hypothetical protein